MKHLFIFIFCLSTLTTAATAKGNDDIDIFARYECQREHIYVGDSILVNLVIYANHPFMQAENTSKVTKFRGGHVRTISQRGERQQQKVRLEKGIYYAIIWQQYIAGSDIVENIRFPEQQFDVTLQVYNSEVQYSPLDPFGFFTQPQRKSHKVKSRCKSRSFSLSILPLPKRSTQEIISSGGKII